MHVFLVNRVEEIKIKKINYISIIPIKKENHYSLFLSNGVVVEIDRYQDSSNLKVFFINDLISIIENVRSFILVTIEVENLLETLSKI